MASIEERKNADLSVTYRVRWRERDESGRPARRTVTFCTADHQDQAAALAEAFAELLASTGDRWPTGAQLTAAGFAFMVEPEPPTPAPPAAGAMSVTDMVLAYVGTRRTSSSRPITARTHRDYVAHIRRYLAGEPLGQRDCTDPAIVWADVEAWQAELMRAARPGGRRPLSSTSALQLRANLLDPAFKWACGPKSTPDGPIRTAANPCAYADKPSKAPVPVRAILATPDEYAVFIEVAYAVDPNWADMAIATAAIGARFGEITQLRPDAIVAGRSELVITERWTGWEVEQGDKNEHRRTVPVPELVMEKIILPRVSRRDPFLFAGPGRGTRWRQCSSQDRWSKVRDALTARGMARHLTHHCLRHSYHTWLTSTEINQEKIALAMGHSTGTMGARYTQLTEVDKAQIRTALAPLFATLTALA
jgi:integrase